MSEKADALLWNRMRINIPSIGIDIDTGLTQSSKDFAAMSPNEPPLGVTAAVSPPNGTPPASRVQVVPLSPMTKWFSASVTHGEPYFSTVTNTVHVHFATNGESSVQDLNVLFWDPHSMVGPGDADTYSP